jgi:hypothetical protein
MAAGNFNGGHFAGNGGRGWSGNGGRGWGNNGWNGGWGPGAAGAALGLGGLYAFGGYPYAGSGYCDPYYNNGYCGSYGGYGGYDW